MRIWVFLSITMLLGCPGKKDDGTKTSGSGSAPVPAAPAGIELFVDDVSVAKITPDQIAKWPRLDALVPADSARLGTWMSVSLTSSKQPPTEIAKPSANYPDMVPALFPGEGGPAFGMFDPVELAKKGQPGLRADGVHVVKIKLAKEGRGGDHQGGAGDGSDPTKLVLAIKTADGDKTLTGEQILALPREPMPGMEDTRGWRVTSLLEAAGVTKYRSLTLIDAGGASLPISKREISDKSVPFIKLNKQGSLRFRLMKKQGEGWQPAGDLRSLVEIQVKS